MERVDAILAGAVKTLRKERAKAGERIVRIKQQY